jgi:hypothetical protein
LRPSLWQQTLRERENEEESGSFFHA